MSMLGAIAGLFESKKERDSKMNLRRLIKADGSEEIQLQPGTDNGWIKLDIPTVKEEPKRERRREFWLQKRLTGIGGVLRGTINPISEWTVYEDEASKIPLLPYIQATELRPGEFITDEEKVRRELKRASINMSDFKFEKFIMMLREEE